MNSSNAPTEENQQPNLSGVAFDSTVRGEEQSVSGPSTETRGVKRRPTGKLSTKSKWTQRRASKEGRGSTVARDTASSVAPGEQNDNIVAGLDEEEAAVNGGAMGLDNEAERVDGIGVLDDGTAALDDDGAAVDVGVAAGMDNEAMPVEVIGGAVLDNEAVLDDEAAALDDDEAAALDDDEAAEGVEEAEPAEEHTTSWSLGISLVHGNRRPDLARMREQSAYGSVENRKNSGNPKRKWREPVTQGKGETKPIRGRTEILSMGAIREVESWKCTATDW